MTLISARATSRPVIYPNNHVNEVGNEQARQDINKCIQLAKSSDAKLIGTDEVA